MLAQKYFCRVENHPISICFSRRTHGNAADLCFSKQMLLHHAKVGLIFLEESLKLHLDLRTYQAKLVFSVYNGLIREELMKNSLSYPSNSHLWRGKGSLYCLLIKLA